MSSYGPYDNFLTSGVPMGSGGYFYCFILVPMANIMTFLHEGFPWVPVDFKVDLFYVHTNNYGFL